MGGAGDGGSEYLNIPFLPVSPSPAPPFFPSLFMFISLLNFPFFFPDFAIYLEND